jgi:hypothetical protein
LNPWIHSTKELLLWKSPERSGLALVSGLFGIITLTTFARESIRIFSALGFWVTLFNLIYVGGIRLMQTVAAPPGASNAAAPHPYSTFLTRARFLNVSESTVRHVSTLALTVFAIAFRYLLRVVLIADIMTSIKAMGSFYLLWNISVYIPISVLSCLSLIVLFSVPVSYDRNRVVIEKQQALLAELVKEKLGLYVQFIRIINLIKIAVVLGLMI